MAQDGQLLPRRSLTRWLIDTWTGAPIDAAFFNLHAAEVALANLYSDEDIEARIPDVLLRLRSLHSTDPRRAHAEKLLSRQTHRAATSGAAGRHSWQEVSDSARWMARLEPHQRDDGDAGARRLQRYVLRDAMRVGYDAQDELYVQVRNYRNILFTVTVSLMLLVIAVCIVGAWRPGAIPLCFQPSNTGGTSQVSITEEESFVCPSTTGYAARPKGGDVSVVALMGLLGGLLSGTLSVHKYRSDSTPYVLSLFSLLLSLSAGALTGIVGLLLMHGQFIPGLDQVDSQEQILAWAFILGVAQVLVVKYTDQRAVFMLATIPQPAVPRDGDEVGRNTGAGKFED